jgi:membrane protein DedA with SNARE-associated domain
MVFSFTETAVVWIQIILTSVGIPGLFSLLALESFGFPFFPGEIVLPFAGVLLSKDAVGLFGIPFTWVTVVLSALAGAFLGATIAYSIGSHFGMPFIRRVGTKVSLSEKDISRAEKFFERRGEATIFISRMVPLFKDYISYPAGAAKMNRARFSLFTLAGSFPLTLALVYAGVVLGENISALDPYFTLLDVVAVALIVILVAFVLFRRRGRGARSEGRDEPRPAPEERGR